MSETSKVSTGSNIGEDTKLKVAYIGVGNAGCQVGIKLGGIPVFLVNTSFKDLNGGIVPAGVPSYLVEDPSGRSRGAGRNRDMGKTLFEDSAIMKNDLFIDFIKDKDIIIIGASTAGGTGSAIAPTMAYVVSERYPNKNVILSVILPREEESTHCQYNTIEMMDEINQLQMPYMAYDLEKGTGPLDEIYTKLAAQVSENISLLAGDMNSITKHGMIDERDLLTITTEPGLMTIIRKNNIDLSKMGEKGIQGIIVDAIKNTFVCTPQKDKICKYFGIYLEVPEECEDDIKNSKYQILEDTFGKPWDIFLNYTVVDRSTAAVGFIASGESYPMDRLAYCEEVVKKYGSTKKSRIYSQDEAVSEAAHLATNDNIGKLLNSSNSSPIVPLEEINSNKPAFLKPRNKI